MQRSASGSKVGLGCFKKHRVASLGASDGQWRGQQRGSAPSSVPRAQAFKATGGVRADFVALCNACGVVPHPSFMPPRETGEEDAGEDPTLVVRSMLLDRAASRVLRFVLPEATRLQTLRISGCSLDVEQLGLLRLRWYEPIVPLTRSLSKGCSCIVMAAALQWPIKPERVRLPKGCGTVAHAPWKVPRRTRRALKVASSDPTLSEVLLREPSFGPTIVDSSKPCFPQFGQIWPTSNRARPNLAEFANAGPNVAVCGQTLLEVGPDRPVLAKAVEKCPSMARTGDGSGR